MVESDHSDTPDDASTKVSNLDESTDSIHTLNKRKYEKSPSEESLNVSKKRCTSVEEEAKSVKAPENISVSESNGHKKESLGKETQEPIENGKSLYLCKEKINSKSKESHIVEVEEKKNMQKLNDNNHSSNEPASSENDVSICEKSMEKEDTENTDAESEKEDKNTNAFKKDNIRSSQSKDAEVVDGLELSVECASDNEGSSSKSDTDTEMKPRPKTIIVKAKPNESELDVSSSETEKSDKHELKDVAIVKKNTVTGKKKDSKKVSNKSKTSESEDSLDNNSDDEDYNSSNRKKPKKSSMTRKLTKSRSDSKKSQGSATKRKLQETNSSKDAKNDIKDKDKDNDVNEDLDDDNTDDDNDDSDNIGDVDVTLTDKANKSVSKEKKKIEQNLSSDESSDDKSENDEMDDEGQKQKKRSMKPEDNKKIQSLKKYIRAAGIYVKSYQELWAGCKTNTARIKQLTSLLKKHGIDGRPTLAKCKKAKANNEKLKEISELDKRNIISEVRITRARRNKDNEDANKQSVTTSDTPKRHRETRNAYKRIQSVIDSDSE